MTGLLTYHRELLKTLWQFYRKSDKMMLSDKKVTRDDITLNVFLLMLL